MVCKNLYFKPYEITRMLGTGEIKKARIKHDPQKGFSLYFVPVVGVDVRYHLCYARGSRRVRYWNRLERLVHFAGRVIGVKNVDLNGLDYV